MLYSRHYIVDTSENKTITTLEGNINYEWVKFSNTDGPLSGFITPKYERKRPRSYGENQFLVLI
jgi:hypothetical protein